MKTFLIAFIIVIAVPLLIVTVLLLRKNSSPPGPGSAGGNVTMDNGTQIITIMAKGGYRPNVTTARANVPTVIKMVTSGTFDCSSALVIPALKYSTNLPPSGETRIPLSAQAPGTTMRGLCSMGMYHFAIHFN